MDHEDGIGDTVLGGEIDEGAHEAVEGRSIDRGGQIGAWPVPGRPRRRGGLRRKGREFDHDARSMCSETRSLRSSDRVSGVQHGHAA